ncbi:hypothetical protein EVAR_16692_1 [Eumeta japonica]|uniref:Uncharacterized protein n=1 Tax=Eumeta variegata TaxID=151549 RepID=A0A4C1V5L4_EUMVA|nr:hypothetical protein EVAR_16692_1 [Eumeta japonica]
MSRNTNFEEARDINRSKRCGGGVDDYCAQPAGDRDGPPARVLALSHTLCLCFVCVCVCLCLANRSATVTDRTTNYYNLPDRKMNTNSLEFDFIIKTAAFVTRDVINNIVVLQPAERSY